MNSKVKSITVTLFFLIWVFGFFIWGLIAHDSDISLSERRKLQTFPELNLKNLSSGSFMSDFEKYSADQFPFRDSFRRIKSIGEYFLFNQSDSNGIYLYNGYASSLEKEINEESLDYAAGRMRLIYESFLKDKANDVYLSVIPDKNYFMKKSGAPTLDYEALASKMREKTDFLEYIDIFPYLELSDYYKTDTHWRIEKIAPVADALAKALGVSLSMEYEVRDIGTPFYGVFYGQSALPMPGEKIYYIWNDAFDSVSVFNMETGGYSPIYDLDRASGSDPYEVYLSGPRSMMVIENPNASTDKELVIIRDSFGSSLAPYLIEAYKKITLLDIRYLPTPMLGRFVDFEGSDVLFIYSAMILNSSETLT